MPGKYTLSATPYSAPRSGEVKGSTLIIHFEVVSKVQQPCTTPNFEPVTTSEFDDEFSSPISLVDTGDFNSDGILDMAVLYERGYVTLLAGKSEGGFKEIATYVSSGTDNMGGVAGDFNGDGQKDLVSMDHPSSSVILLLGKGNGTFSPITIYHKTGFLLRALTAADSNGDSKLDLFLGITHTNSTDVVALLGTGDGRFVEKAILPILKDQSFGIALATSDFNGDGMLDLAVGYYGNAYGKGIYLGNGDGSFAEEVIPFNDKTGHLGLLLVISIGTAENI